MESIVTVEQLSEIDWVRYRDIRIAALENDGEAFGGNLQIELLYTQEQWREKASQYVGLIAVVAGVDIGMMAIENLKGDFGATCWVGSCWVDPEYRMHGALRALFAYLDAHATTHDWKVQGLGVWIDNHSAIAAYEKLGFAKVGEPQESTRKPGLYYQRMIRSTK